MSNYVSPQVRLLNVLNLEKSFASQKILEGNSTVGLGLAFAQHLEISHSLWSQIKGGRTIGNSLARQIESKCSVPTGWLDEEHEVSTPDPHEEKFIALCRQAWQVSSQSQRKDLKTIMRTALSSDKMHA
jgi:hypothetical protein